MTSNDPKIVFMPSGLRGTFKQGTSILEAARSLGVDLDSVCGGRGLCGRCQVACVEGKFTKHAITSNPGHLSAPGEVEQRYSTRRQLISKNRRLGCQALIEGDLVIDVPSESQIHRQLVRKNAEQHEIKLKPSLHLYFVEVQEADMYESSSDITRLFHSMSAEWHLSDLTYHPSVLTGMQSTLRKGKWQVTVAVHNQSKIVAIWPGLKQNIYGLAVDIGSTTMAAHLCNLANGDVLATSGIMNPQIRFGEDLMSRVSYVMMHPEGSNEMRDSVRAGVNLLIKEVVTDAEISSSDILEVSIAGNPVMHHLFLGISPVELGGAPFALATDEALNISARDLDLEINPGGNVYVLPCIAGHVGADAAAMVLAEEPHKLESVSLIVDVGTNAEIILGNRDRLLACSSPTGPAFEGAQISCGQRAAPGAIERVRINPETLEVRFSVIGSNLWSDEPGFDESICNFGVSGICGSGIIEAVAEMYLNGIISEDGVVDGTMAERSDRLYPEDRTWSFILYDGVQRVSVSQTDVRQIQLAKAALYAGAKLLMDHAGVEQVDRIRLAGAFGSHIDARYAMVLGLIPDCELANVESAGNAAGTGARIALLNIDARREIESVVRNIEKIETAVEPKFQEYFVDAMAFPNKKDAFPKLFSFVKKPEAKTVIRAQRGHKRRRHK